MATRDRFPPINPVPVSISDHAESSGKAWDAIISSRISKDDCFCFHGCGDRLCDRNSRKAELFDEDIKGNEYLLDLANLLRTRVEEWRKREYQGATKVTRELIEVWRAPDREQPLFYAQLEAVETLIFLVEGPPDLLQGIHVPSDEPGPAAREAGYKAFQRYALKMATGSGKTTVMGMLAAWSILNKVADQKMLPIPILC